MVKMSKKLLTFLIIFSFLVEATGVSYALRPMATYVTRSSITEASGGLKLAEDITESFYRVAKEVLEETFKDFNLTKDASIAIVGIGSAARREMAPGSDADIIILFGLEESINKDRFVEKLKKNFKERVSRYVSVLAYGTTEECLEQCQFNPFAGEGAKQHCLIVGDESLLSNLITIANKSMGRKSGFPFIIKADDPISASSIFFDIWDYEREHVKFGDKTKSLPLDIKKGRGMMRDILTICMIGMTFYGIQGKNSSEVLRTMKEKGYLVKEDFDKLVAALDFYLLVRNKLHSLFVAQGGNLWDKNAEDEKDMIDSHSLEKLAVDTGFSSTEEFKRALFGHQSNVLGIYKNIQINLMEKLTEIYGEDWVGMLEKACSKNALLEDTQDILNRCRGLKEEGYPILFALAWYSSHITILEEIYRKNVPCLYIQYALSCNAHTPNHILSDLRDKEGREYAQIVKRAKENLQKRQDQKPSLDPKGSINKAASRQAKSAPAVEKNHPAVEPNLRVYHTVLSAA